MPNRISTVAMASLASALMLLLLEARGSAAAPKNTRQQCEIDYDVCWRIGCKGFTGKELGRCTADCDLRLVKCNQEATKKEAKPNNDAKPKKGINGVPTGTWVPNSPKKGIDGTPTGTWVPNSPKKGIGGTSSGQWVPNSPSKGKGVPSVPAGGTWNPSASSSAKGPILRSGSGRR
jgi:hypothetical protein